MKERSGFSKEGIPLASKSVNIVDGKNVRGIQAIIEIFEHTIHTVVGMSSWKKTNFDFFEALWRQEDASSQARTDSCFHASSYPYADTEP